jgi:exopolyphosphatase/guanosine-5'-triphosphate,3'-diphosphate pyrophosphatase
MTPVAALDCGTNSTRLLVLDADGRPLERRMVITRLGQGVDATGVLRSDAIDRTLEVLRSYRAVMEHHGVRAARLAATSAARDASNGPAFLEAAASASGVRAELLSGEEEGRLSFSGATADYAGPIDTVVVVDIGGGSTELVTRVAGNLVAHSMQVGCVRVTERAMPGDPPTPEQLDAAARMVDEAIDAALVELPSLAVRDDARQVLGLAGTVSTLAMVDLGLVDYDEAKVHHHWLSIEAIRGLRDELAAETTEDRRHRPGMVPGREDVIVAGAVVLERVVVRLGASGCLTSEHDILDGLARSILTR